MPDRDIREQHYPTVEFVLDAIAGWINKYRHMHGARDELGGRCNADCEGSRCSSQ